MLRSYFTTLCLMATLSAAAQNANLHWAELLTVENNDVRLLPFGKIGESLFFVRIALIPGSNETKAYDLVRYDYPPTKAEIIRLGAASNQTDENQLIHYDSINSQLKFVNKKIDNNSNEYIYQVNSFDFKGNHLEKGVILHRQPTGDFSGRAKRLASDLTTVSPDKTKILFYQQIGRKTSEPVKLSLTLANGTLSTLLWSRELTLKYLLKDADIENVSVNNNGDVAILIKRDNPDRGSQSKEAKKIYSLIFVDKNGDPRETVLSIQEKQIESVGLITLDGNLFSCSGFYTATRGADRQKTGGYFALSINPTNNEILNNYYGDANLYPAGVLTSGQTNKALNYDISKTFTDFERNSTSILGEEFEFQVIRNKTIGAPGFGPAGTGGAPGFGPAGTGGGVGIGINNVNQNYILDYGRIALLRLDESNQVDTIVRIPKFQRSKLSSGVSISGNSSANGKTLNTSSWLVGTTPSISNGFFPFFRRDYKYEDVIERMGYYSSFHHKNYKGYDYFIYNDDPDNLNILEDQVNSGLDRAKNLKNSSVFLAIVDPTGKLTKSILTNNKDELGAVLVPKLCLSISKSEILVLADWRRDYRIGILTLTPQ